MSERFGDVIRKVWPPDLRGIAEELAEPFPGKAAPPVISADTRVAEWSDRLEALIADEREGGGDEVTDFELLAEGLGLLQNATDRALGSLERSTERAAAEAAAKAADTIAALREEVAKLHSARPAGCRTPPAHG